MQYDDVTNAFSVTGTYTGLAGAQVGAHLHGAAPPGVNAAVILTLSATGGTSGSFSASATLTSTAIGYLAAGNTYIDIHSVAFPGGELRGQVNPDITLLTLTSSAPITPGASLVFTPQLPVSFQCVLGGTSQTVELISATINVAMAPISGIGEYESLTITSAQGSFGPAILNGIPCPGSSFVLASPGTGRINYSTGSLFVELELLITAAGFIPIHAAAFTSGVVSSPTSVRLLNGGDSLELPSGVPAVSTVALFILATLILLVGAMRLRSIGRVRGGHNPALLAGVIMCAVLGTSCKKKTTLREETGLPSSNVGLSGTVLAQSFAARVDYTLDKVKITLDECQGSTLTRIDLYVQDGPGQSANVLANATAFAPSSPYDLEFSPLDPSTLQKISIPVNQLRYIRLEGLGQCSWGMNSSEFYGYGAAFENGVAVPGFGNDFCLKIYSVEEIASPSH